MHKCILSILFLPACALTSDDRSSRIVGGELVPPDSDDFQYHISLVKPKKSEKENGLLVHKILCGATLISLE